MKHLIECLGIFEGPSSSMHFGLDLISVFKQRYFLAGQLCAWSAVHSGIGLNCLAPYVVSMMLGEFEQLDNLNSSVVTDEDFRRQLETVIIISFVFLIC